MSNQAFNETVLTAQGVPPGLAKHIAEKFAELERALDFNLQGNRESVARIVQLEREIESNLSAIRGLEFELEKLRAAQP